MDNRDRENEEGVWRSESELPLEELDRAVATSPTGGQGDDATGGDAGAEEAFGHGAWSDSEPEDGDDAVRERRMRPSPEGRIGPA